MYRDLVEKRRWISESDYKEGMALAQLMPGPLAAQLAIYLGYVHFQSVGATLAGLAFVLPSFLMVVALGAAYQAFGGIAWMQAVFYGVGAAVIGIIAMSAYKLTTKNIGRTSFCGPSLQSALPSLRSQSPKWCGCSWARECWSGSGVRLQPGHDAGNLRAIAAPSRPVCTGDVRLAQTQADRWVFRLRRQLRVWQRPGHRALLYGGVVRNTIG
jgi:hypothetical protein